MKRQPTHITKTNRRRPSQPKANQRRKSGRRFKVKRILWLLLLTCALCTFLYLKACTDAPVDNIPPDNQTQPLSV